MHLNRSVLGDGMEDHVGAVYLAGGLDAARAFVLRHWEQQIGLAGQPVKDAKTFLQEWALGKALPIPTYRVVSRAGPEHEPVFVVEVEVAGRPPATGAAGSKRGAEQLAAEDFLKREGIRS